MIFLLVISMLIIVGIIVLCLQAKIKHHDEMFSRLIWSLCTLLMIGNAMILLFCIITIGLYMINNIQL
jgi:archaellum biogenesis protein FlaJ (TadC family)